MTATQPSGRIRIQATSLRRQLRDALDHVLRGGEVIISRNGRDEALLTPMPAPGMEPTEATPDDLLTECRFRRRINERAGEPAAPGPLWRGREAS